VSSWRDDTSQQAQDELDDLLDVAIRAAQQRLDDAGEFYPFAVTSAEVGDVEVLTPQVPTGPRAVADVAEVFELCWATLRDRAETARAGAVVANVGGPDGDAVAVALEHRDGPSIEVFLPYVTQGKTNGKKPPQKHRFGDLQAAPGQSRIWDTDQGTSTTLPPA
jgi:hypothetical protein